MKRLGFNVFLRGLIIGLVLVLIGANGFSYWYLNYSDSAYQDNSGKRLFYDSVSINSCIRNGAGYFLESYSNTLLFMKVIELDGELALSNDSTQKYLEASIESIASAHDMYRSLSLMSSNTTYDALIVDSLRRFNYDKYMTENVIIDEVFLEVKKYLEVGDVFGVYEKIMSDIVKIEVILNKIKSHLSENSLPPLSTVWELNQAYSGSLLFGQYVAQVFSSILTAR